MKGEFSYVDLEREEQGDRAVAEGFYSTAGSFGFGGLPLPGTLRIASRAERLYMASAVIGLILATYSRCLTALGSIPSSVAISEVVQPSSILCGMSQVYPSWYGRSRKIKKISFRA